MYGRQSQTPSTRLRSLDQRLKKTLRLNRDRILLLYAKSGQFTETSWVVDESVTAPEGTIVTAGRERAE